MFGKLTPAQQTVIERAAQLTRANIAPRAAHYDAIAANPVEMIAIQLFTGLVLPAQRPFACQTQKLRGCVSSVILFALNTPAPHGKGSLFFRRLDALFWWSAGN